MSRAGSTGSSPKRRRAPPLHGQVRPGPSVMRMASPSPENFINARILARAHPPAMSKDKRPGPRDRDRAALGGNASGGRPVTPARRVPVSWTPAGHRNHEGRRRPRERLCGPTVGLRSVRTNLEANVSRDTSRSTNAPKARSKKSTPPKKRPKETRGEDADDQRVKQGDYSDKYSSGRKVS